MGKVILFPKNRDYYRFNYGWPKFDGHLQIVANASRPTLRLRHLLDNTAKNASVVERWSFFLSNHVFHY
jgi:hypothetical protein